MSGWQLESLQSPCRTPKVHENGMYRMICPATIRWSTHLTYSFTSDRLLSYHIHSILRNLQHISYSGPYSCRYLDVPGFITLDLFDVLDTTPHHATMNPLLSRHSSSTPRHLTPTSPHHSQGMSVGDTKGLISISLYSIRFPFFGVKSIVPSALFWIGNSLT